MKVYRGTDGDVEPVEMECEKFGYPNKTTTGETMYDNTHFRTIESAWKSILESIAAGVSLVGGSVRNAEDELARLRKIAGDRAKEFDLAHTNYRRWKTHNKSLHVDQKSGAASDK